MARIVDHHGFYLAGWAPFMRGLMRVVVRPWFMVPNTQAAQAAQAISAAWPQLRLYFATFGTADGPYGPGPAWHVIELGTADGFAGTPLPSPQTPPLASWE